ncbi:MAG: apolipoprotein N-acyltransferase [Deltaproteobacteria bacterium]|nr:apolipoprotein N-acyltransferase [Deltaproteobacteria bacterium]
MTRYRRPLLAAAGGVVSALALPPTDVYPAMLVGLALFAAAIRGVDGFWRGFGLGALWGTAGQLIGMRFVPSVIQMFTDLGMAAALLAHVLLSAAQSLHWALGMGLAAVLHRRFKTPLELSFGGGMLLALCLPSVFVWSPAGLLSPWPIWVQSAEYVGERGVSVLLAIVAALAVRATIAQRRHGWTRPTKMPAAAALGMLALMAAHGAWAMHRWGSEEGDTARLALIHAAVDPKVRWQKSNWPRILAELKRQTAAAEATGVDLSVWPEAAYPYKLPNTARRAPRGRRQLVGGAVRGPILFGLITQASPVQLPSGQWERNKYNSATLVFPNGRLLAPYDKMELLWFGETVPLGQHLPWLRRLFQRSGGLIPGAELRGLTLERRHGAPLQMAVLNCYEDTLPTLGRRMMRQLRPNLLVNVTNDAWFVGTQEPVLHERLAAMRSIELRRDMVRAVNLGVTGWIDAAGRVRARREATEPGWLLVTPSLRQSPPTLYARFGDLPMVVALVLGIAGVGLRRPLRRDEAIDSV